MKRPAPLRFYNLSETSWDATQGIVCALAQLGRDAVVLSRSHFPCVCAGGQVNLEHQIDSEFCRTQGIPVYRRETRGSTLCFAQSQVEIQMVLGRDHPLVTGPAVNRFRPVLSPLFETLSDLMLAPAYQGSSEIVVRGRRIANACACELNQRLVIGAALALEFDPEVFQRVLNVRDDDLRARFEELVRARRTSLRQELGTEVPSNVLEQKICEHLAAATGGLEPADLDDELRERMIESGAAMFAPARFQNRPVVTGGWHLEVGGGTELQQCAYKAPGGLLRATSEWHCGRIVHASLGGDFFCYPAGALFRLEKALVGVRSDQVEMKLAELYGKLGLVTPGINAGHWAKVLSLGQG